MIIIIAGLVLIYQSGGSIDVATVSFAQITENMKQMPWLHAVIEAAGDRLEVWFSYERRILVAKLPSGEIRYQDDLKQNVRIYDPKANTITISRVTPDSLASMGSTALDLPKSILTLFDDANDKDIQQETDRYKGKKVKIYKFSGTDIWGAKEMKIELVVDAEMNVLLFINQKAFDKDGHLAIEANGYFDYPETGPNTIYEVGVPTSAKIIRPEEEKDKTAYDKAFEEAISVVDSRESWPEPRDLAIAYWEKRNAKEYDELAVFWPGSATWNHRIIKDEEHVEYVFGKAQAAEDMKDTLIVPYANKKYFEKSGKYNLKMRLRNDKSAKGRYYIFSGN